MLSGLAGLRVQRLEELTASSYVESESKFAPRSPYWFPKIGLTAGERHLNTVLYFTPKVSRPLWI